MKTISRRCVLLALLFAGCGLDALPPEKANYAGSWRNASAGVSLTISPRAHVEYVKRSGATTTIDAPIQKFEGNDFLVGALGITTRFHVENPPVRMGDDWFMLVDGVKLTRMSP